MTNISENKIGAKKYWLKKILSLPAAYSFFQKSLGGKKASKFFTEYYVKAASNSRILDSGCGPSEILVHPPKDVQYIGYDLSEKYIHAARTQFGNRGIWHCAPVTEIDVNEVGTFDIVIAIGILHHLDCSLPCQVDSEDVEFSACCLNNLGGNFPSAPWGRSSL